MLDVFARMAESAYLRSVAGPTRGSRYAAWLPTRSSEGACRVAWCYGDLGVAVALMSAAIATGRLDWRGDALELAHGMAERSFESSLVRLDVARTTQGTRFLISFNPGF